MSWISGKKASLQSILGLEVAQQVDILERPTQTSFDIMPWKITNFVVLMEKCDSASAHAGLRNFET